VRDELWERAMKTAKGKGAVLQIWSDNNPQGFSHRQMGMRDREFVDIEGLALIRISPHKGTSAKSASADTKEG
jgi:hypothetical protein